ncbi:MAG: cobalt transporter [Frankiales bacterium]|nr:cobalt transporter [Frankiales bacterium]
MLRHVGVAILDLGLPDRQGGDPARPRPISSMTTTTSLRRTDVANSSPSSLRIVAQRHAAHTGRAPIAVPLSAGAWWLVATALFSLLLYYFVGIDQGAVSVFGSDMHLHEFLHDGRHFMAFACH